MGNGLFMVKFMEVLKCVSSAVAVKSVSVSTYSEFLSLNESPTISRYN